MKATLRSMIDRAGPYEAAVLGVVLLIAARFAVRFFSSNPGPITADALLRAGFGVVILIVAVATLLLLVRWLLGFGSGAIGVARTVLDEALRLKIALVFIIALLVVLPLMPFTIGVTQPVRYRVQSFLGYGFTLTWVLLALMTIFLACWTLSAEVADKQIFTTATKPISRGAYLFGKWLGIVALDGVLLAVAGLAIYGFTVFYLAQLTPHNIVDAVELHSRVLVARVSAEPQPLRPFDEQAVEKLKELIATQPAVIEELGRSRANEMGITAGQAKIIELGKEAAFYQVLDTLQKEWMSIGPLASQTYVFDGLQNAKDYGPIVQWRYKASTTKTVPDDQLKVVIDFNDRRKLVNLVTGSTQEYPVLTDAIDENGRLAVTVRHYNPEINAAFDTSISFRADEMRVLFQVDTFGANFTRAMIAVWIKLAFLAMLGLAAATFLSFPVACMGALVVFGGAIMSDYLLEAVGGFGARSEGVVAIVQGAIAFVAWSVASTLGAWSRYSPGHLITDGLLFSWSDVLGCLLWIGVVWTGLTALLAWLIFRKRELARVQV